MVRMGAHPMMTSDKGRAFIESYEGLFLRAYDDYNDHIVKPGQEVRGTLTIGYGHTSAAGKPEVYVGQEITVDDADDILKSDLAAVEHEVSQYIKVPLTQQQFDALVSFQFNTGWLAHPHCSLTGALNEGNYNLAARDFALYDIASGRVLSGLVRRRKAEHDIFLNGNYVGNNGAIV